MSRLTGLLLCVLLLTPCASRGDVPPGSGTEAFKRLDGQIAKWDRMRNVPMRSRVEWRSLQELNDVINLTPYREDRQDEWLEPDVFLARGGDCEDFAIAKLVELGARGIAERWLVVAWDVERERHHAFALTREASTWLVLDNQIGRLFDWREVLLRYRPIYAIDVSRDELYQWLSDPALR